MFNLNFHQKTIAIAMIIALLSGYTLVYSAEETKAGDRSVGPQSSTPTLLKPYEKEALEAIDKGLEWLRGKQEPDGSFGGYLGFTGLAATAFLKHPSGKYKSTDPFIKKTLDYIVSLQNKDGSIYDKSSQPALPNYNTSVSIMALTAANDPKYDEVIKKAQGYIKGIQRDEGEGYAPDDKFYGGIGYGSNPSVSDLSNMSMALQALKASNLEDQETWSKAIQFLERCQNYSETNDQVWAINDGGFIYSPDGASKAGKDENGIPRSYASMTYAGLLSFIYAGVDKDDKRVQAAVDWIKRHYTFEENPPIGKQGLYYNYHTMAKALDAYDEPVITDAKDRKHNWYKELSRKLVELQRSDGFWINEEDRWFETNPILVTAYAVLALEAGFPEK